MSPAVGQRRGPAWLAFVTVFVLATAVTSAVEESSSLVASSTAPESADRPSSTPAAPTSAVPLQQSSPRGPDVREAQQEALQKLQQLLIDQEKATSVAVHQVAAKDTSLAVQADSKGHPGLGGLHTGHGGHTGLHTGGGHTKPIKIKKKKPMGKHKKKKQSYKDKLMPLLLIPFVIQMMLIPMFIMNLKMLAMKAMAVGKFAILLIAFNMFRSWSQNAHSTSVRGTMVI